MSSASRSDGIRTSSRPPGRLAQRWLAILDGVDPRVRPRVVRGRTLARGGRVKELELAPGAALGEVRDAEPQRPTLRVRTFDEAEWSHITELLCSRLDLLAHLFEGEVTDELLALLEERRVPLLPAVSEIDGDCDCGDWAVPCAHGAAIYHLLGEVLEGEPFLLFTLRGRPREQLLNDLRRRWGDAGPHARGSAAADEALPEGDPFDAPEPLAPVTFRFAELVASRDRPTTAGMVELGPLVGDEDLGRALQPLYAAGAAFALEQALTATGEEPARRRRASVHPRTSLAPATVPVSPPPASPPPLVVRPPPPPPAQDELAGCIVDAVADAEDGLSVDELVERLSLTDRVLGKELRELERMGLLRAVDGDGVRRYHLN